MSFFDYIIVSAILVWLVAAVCYCIRQKMSGRHTCGGCSGCAGCPRRCRKTQG
jgi:hypothetical protein